MARILAGILLGAVITVGAFLVVTMQEGKGDSLQIIKGELTRVDEVILARQTNKHSYLEEVTRLTNAAIYFKWQSDDAWGVVLTGWRPDPELVDGELRLTVPPLVYFGPNIDLAPQNFVSQVVNSALLVDEQELREAFVATRLYPIVCEHALGMLESDAFRKLAARSLQGFFFNMLGAIDELQAPVRRVVITFEPPAGVPDISGRCA
ncbi:MAG: hypothetical protein OEN55_03670 [Alphaproteobacteria bacterium]|nr:hypothetical protein [Alphaproteobacteria bacterium]